MIIIIVMFFSFLFKETTEAELEAFFGERLGPKQVVTTVLEKDGKFAFVTLANAEAEAAALALHGTALREHKLRIRPRKDRPKGPGSIAAVVEAVAALQLDSFGAQLDTLLAACTPPPERLAEREAVVEAVRARAAQVFADHIVSLTPYGSTVTGLGGPDSDLDLSLHIDRLPPGAHPLEDLAAALGADPDFAAVAVVKKTKCPVLKCQHKASRLHCDVALHNVLGVRNTQLLVHYLNVSPPPSKRSAKKI